MLATIMDIVLTISDWLRKTNCTSKLGACLRLLRRSSYLNTVGWFESFRRSLPLDKKGNAIPWYTYAAIHFLENRLKEEMTVFEFGSGNSTIWWATRVGRVVSCEHDQQWFLKMRSTIPDNVELMHIRLRPSGEYSRAILKYENEFDVIVIDGRDRVNCAKNSLNALKDAGVIIWDDSDRERYRDGYEFLLENGFGRLDFHGFGPVHASSSCTSVFYRDDNCLEV